MFCKYLNPIKLHRNDFVFRFYRWILVFRRRKDGLKIFFLVAEIFNKESNIEIIHFLWDTLYIPQKFLSKLFFLKNYGSEIPYLPMIWTYVQIFVVFLFGSLSLVPKRPELLSFQIVIALILTSFHLSGRQS